MDLNISITLFFLLSAGCGPTPYLPLWYHLVDQEMSWDDAQTYCRNKYTDLATVNNKDEMKKLNTVLQDNHEAWIGLKREGFGEWQWSLEDNILRGTPLSPVVRIVDETYRKWCNNEPDNQNGKEYCVVLEKGEHDTEKCWHDIQCDGPYPFVCYDGNGAKNKKYIYIKENVTWCEAQSYCRANYTDLAIMTNQSDQQEIISEIGSSDNLRVRVWIGLFNNSWKWSDSSDSCFTNWESDAPKNSVNICATVVMNDQDNIWKADDCGTNHTFVCHENQLILINQTSTWTDALRYCREHHLDLVSAHTEEIQSWVKEVSRNASTEHVWLGLVHTCVLGFWFWVGGETYSYQNWATGNETGQEDCRCGDRTGAVQSGGEQQWVSLIGDQKLNFICTTY